eukprot:gene9412-biopygen8894
MHLNVDSRACQEHVAGMWPASPGIWPACLFPAQNNLAGIWPALVLESGGTGHGPGAWTDIALKHVACTPADAVAGTEIGHGTVRARARGAARVDGARGGRDPQPRGQQGRTAESCGGGIPTKGGSSGVPARRRGAAVGRNSSQRDSSASGARAPRGGARGERVALRAREGPAKGQLVYAGGQLVEAHARPAAPLGPRARRRRRVPRSVVRMLKGVRVGHPAGPPVPPLRDQHQRRDEDRADDEDGEEEAVLLEQQLPGQHEPEERGGHHQTGARDHPAVRCCVQSEKNTQSTRPRADAPEDARGNARTDLLALRVHSGANMAPY